MSNILTVDIAKKVYDGSTKVISAKHHFGKVILFINGKGVELTTTIAYGAGLAIARAKLDIGEMIVLSINGEKIDLPEPFAMKVAGAILRKAEDADDFQLGVQHARQTIHGSHRLTSSNRC